MLVLCIECKSNREGEGDREELYGQRGGGGQGRALWTERGEGDREELYGHLWPCAYLD